MQLSLWGYQNRKQRIMVHVLFWISVWVMLTLIYSFGIPGFWFTAGIILMFMPIYLFYYYLIANLGIPKLLYKQKYLSFAVFLLCTMFLATVLFRLVEILIADPIIYSAEKENRPNVIWHKLDGDFWEQFARPSYLITAFEQSNIIIWIAISMKFIKMWFEKKQAAAEAELNFLKSQIHPHFLFNTLNNLYALTLKQSPQSPGIVIGLSKILRYMLYECNTDSIELVKDINIVESYIALEKIRYEDRLDLTFSINGNLSDYRIAPLLLMPFVENAFKHGASEELDEAWINIDLTVKDNLLKFKVSNSISNQLNKIKEKQHGNIGLFNVKKRLDILYPYAHQLRVFEEEDMFVAILELELDKQIDV